ncbi:MAG TPA: ion transporter [Cyclobacteriaceae bacterium]|nr:ion transporter [Cyclobacteriaceae bacterium]
MTLRRRLYLILDPSVKGGVPERIFEFFLVIIIILNILAIILDSVHEVHDDHKVLFYRFETFSVIFFTVEYLARVYCVVEKPQFKKRISGRLKYAVTPMAIIDLMAFLPFYFTFLPLDLRFLRIFRLFGLFRMFKIARYMRALDIFKKVIADRKEQLVLSILFIFFMLIIISSIMYYVERGSQPEAFSSIPATMWWGVSTLTTVGYGDIVPSTVLGKVLGGLFAIVGVGLFALPAGILSSGFYEMIHEKRKITCPHCGKDFHK